MPTNDQLFEAIRLLKDYCKTKPTCDLPGGDDCPLREWCYQSLIPDDAPCEWKVPEGGRNE